jgi:Meckel syndrome type 1 protein
MTTPHRDLALVDPWQRSLHRSLHRRAIAPQVRRSVARRRRASVALSTLMVAGPTGSLLAAAGFGIGGRGVDVAQASPASRAIDNGATPAAMAFELGSRGDAVSEIQRQLGIAADGVFGPVTQMAVQHFQASNGLDVDGVVGPATWTALFGLEQAAAAAGARDGNVAVILRERTAAGVSSPADGPVDGSDTPRPDADAPAGSGPNGDGTARGIGGDTSVSNGAPDDAAMPRTKPVSAPAPADGACGPLRLASPVKGTVTSPYGPRWGRNHDGLDIAAPSGTPIRAAECGIVSFAGVQSGYGNMVCVKHSSRFETCYAHMTKYAVSQGQRVDQGQVIGYVGCTGNCTGPHLHFETRVDGAARDPRPYLGGGGVPGEPAVKAAVSSKTKAVATAAIAKDVQRARFAKAPATATTGGATASGGWSAVPAETVAPPVASAPATQAPAPPVETTTPEPAAAAPAPAEQAPATAAPVPAEATPAPTPAPTTTPEITPAPSYEARTTPAAPPYEAPQPEYSAPPAAPAPAPAPTPAPAAPAPETAPAPEMPAPSPEPAAPVPDPATQPVTEAPAP